MKYKKCPFCSYGNVHTERELIEGGEIYYVYCYYCNTKGPCEDTSEKAIEKWNAARRDDDAVD